MNRPVGITSAGKGPGRPRCPSAARTPRPRTVIRAARDVRSIRTPLPTTELGQFAARRARKAAVWRGSGRPCRRSVLCRCGRCRGRRGRSCLPSTGRIPINSPSSTVRPPSCSDPAGSCSTATIWPCGQRISIGCTKRSVAGSWSVKGSSGGRTGSSGGAGSAWSRSWRRSPSARSGAGSIRGQRVGYEEHLKLLRAAGFRTAGSIRQYGRHHIVAAVS